MTFVERQAHYFEVIRNEEIRRRASRESGCCLKEAEGWGFSLRLGQELTCPVCTGRLKVVRRFRDPLSPTTLRLELDRVGESPLATSLTQETS